MTVLDRVAVCFAGASPPAPSLTKALPRSVAGHSCCVRPVSFRPAVRALAAQSSTAESASPAASSTTTPSTFDLACPICHSTHFTLRQEGGRPMGDPLSCPRCSRTFVATPTYVDLTLTAGVEQTAYQQRSWGGTELFRNPLVSLAYERGWRQSFAWAGFPGVDREFELAMDYLRPAYGSTLVDMSCGSGLFSRRFLSSGRFAGVVAADYSESMLREARQLLDQDSSVDASVAAVHAGAAIHCWPNPQAALAEISRVLRPGGVFVGSTFLTATAPLGAMVGDKLVRPLKALEPSPGAYRWWEEDELRDLCATVGLQGFRRERKNRFILFSATKPGAD